MFIDTHCHLIDDGHVIADMDDVLSRAWDADVGGIICACADPRDVAIVPNLVAGHKNMFATVGIHPEYAGIDACRVITPQILAHPRVVGVGEIGLDYHYGSENRAAQIKLFESQLNMALVARLPVAIHTRDAEEDTMAIIGKSNVGGVLHCFTGSWDLARKMLDRGFYISASGIVTFKNAADIRDTFSRVPMDRIVVETDSPYCAPVPHRGTRCEPAFVADTVRVLADVRGVRVDALTHQLLKNTCALYPKMNLEK